MMLEYRSCRSDAVGSLQQQHTVQADKMLELPYAFCVYRAIICSLTVLQHVGATHHSAKPSSVTGAMRALP